MIKQPFNFLQNLLKVIYVENQSNWKNILFCVF